MEFPKFPSALGLLARLPSPPKSEVASKVIQYCPVALPPPIFVLRELVAMGLVASSTEEVTIDSVLSLTERGAEATRAQRTAQAHPFFVARPQPIPDVFPPPPDSLEAVLAGRASPPLEPMVEATLRVLFGERDVDARLTSHGIYVHFGPERGVSYDRSFLGQAPLLAEILRCAGLERVDAPVLIGLPRALRSWLPSEKLVWILPGTSEVRLHIRNSPERWRRTYVGAIPLEGPLALRELPKRAPRYLTSDQPIACPSCSACSTRYRQVDDYLICSACARSFKVSGAR